MLGYRYGWAFTAVVLSGFSVTKFERKMSEVRVESNIYNIYQGIGANPPFSFFLGYVELI